MRRRIAVLSRFTALLCALTSALAGCNRDSLGPQPEDGFVATWAGKPWVGDARATLVPSGDTLYLSGATPRDAGGMPSATVYITLPAFQGVGVYRLGAEHARYWYLLGGDAISAEYITGSENAGTVEVHEFADGWIRGSVSFDASHTRKSAPAGPSARFRGQFRARVWSRP